MALTGLLYNTSKENDREQWRRSLAEAGLTLVDGSFEEGATVNSNTDAVWYISGGQCYTWGSAGAKTVPAKSTPDSTGGVSINGWNSVSQETLRDEVLPQVGDYAATGAQNKYSREDRARRHLSAVDFGSPETDIGNSVNLAQSSLATEYSDSASVAIRGGAIELPRGSKLSASPITLNKHRSGVLGISIKGQGAQTSEINLTGAPTLTDGVMADTGAADTGAVFVELSDFAIANAPRSAFRLNAYSRTSLERLHANNSGSDGFYFGNGFIAVLDRLTAKSNGASGFNFAEGVQHTSTHINGGYALQNTASGFTLGYMNYSTITSTGSDLNGQYGYVISKSNTFISNAAGAEENGRSGVAVLSSTAKGPTTNVTINNFYAHLNNKSVQGYPNLLYVQAQGAVAAQVRISKSFSSPASGDTTPDIIADGIGAEVEIDDCTLPNGWRSQNGGYIHWRHKTLLVRSKAIGTSTSTPICNLKSTQGHTRFSGTLTVLASNNSPDVEARNTAIYQLLVSKSILNGYQVIEIAKAGHTTGLSTSAPAFTFSMAADQLIATPVGSAAGNFWFEIDAQSQVVALSL